MMADGATTATAAIPLKRIAVAVDMLIVVAILTKPSYVLGDRTKTLGNHRRRPCGKRSTTTSGAEPQVGQEVRISSRQVAAEGSTSHGFSLSVESRRKDKPERIDADGEFGGDKRAAS